jgi:hypothetical protein
MMPVISMFYGLIVAMYYLDTKQHHFPHIHVRYGEAEAVFRLPDGLLLGGELRRARSSSSKPGSNCTRTS